MVVCIEEQSFGEQCRCIISQPGKLDWASSGTGGGQHLFGELFMSMAAIKITHISYKGSGAAAADLP